tara:strand:+ start:1338 stop:1769 length:432 start_codon:yes stop_codon:yes gene_type:complete
MILQKLKMKKKGQILVENVIFIILNLIFLTILILFIYSKSGSEAILEEKYAKQIALIIDSAKPEMKILLNMEDAIEKAKTEWSEDKIGEIVSVEGNNVIVKLREKGGYSYSFFNDVPVSVYPDEKNSETGKIENYVIFIEKVK